VRRRDQRQSKGQSLGAKLALHHYLHLNYCFVNDNCPFVNGAVQVLVPE
jgi:hypothetical protein